MTELQSRLWAAIKARANGTRMQVTYRREWLGYLPFGLYHWLECDGEDFSHSLPENWAMADMKALETHGALLQVSSWQNPDDEEEIEIVYAVCL